MIIRMMNKLKEGMYKKINEVKEMKEDMYKKVNAFKEDTKS
jgi:hypothetical protein